MLTALLCLHKANSYSSKFTQPRFHKDEYREKDKIEIVPVVIRRTDSLPSHSNATYTITKPIYLNTNQIDTSLPWPEVEQNILKLVTNDFTGLPNPDHVPYNAITSWQPVDEDQDGQYTHVSPVYVPAGYDNSNSIEQHQYSKEYYNYDKPLDPYNYYKPEISGYEDDGVYIKNENYGYDTDRVDSGDKFSFFNLLGKLVKMVISRKRSNRRQVYESTQFVHDEAANAFPNVTLRGGITIGVLETAQELLLQMLNWLAFIATDITMQIIWPTAGTGKH